MGSGMLESKDAIQLFTSQAIQRIAGGDYSLLFKVVDEYLKPKFKSIKVAEVFNLTLEKASSDYRNEYYYKNTIANKILLKKHAVQSATMLTEFRVGSSKADCVILNGLSTCYEIKTEFDTLKRLPEQLLDYSKVFDKIFVITSSHHLSQVIDLTPQHIGVIELTKKGALKEIRKAALIQSEIDPTLMIQSLRREEYLEIASTIIGKNIQINNMDAYSFCMSIMQKVDSTKLRILFRKVLKKHRRLNPDIYEEIPRSLITSFVSYKIRPTDRENLKQIMNRYIDKENLCISQ